MRHLAKGPHEMALQKRLFSPQIFLTTAGAGRKMISYRRGQTIYAEGDAADAVFVIQTGTVKLSVKSGTGKVATLDILGETDFVGKDSIAGQSFRTASATALTECRLLRVEKQTIALALKHQVKLANFFWVYVLGRNLRYQRDLVDHCCNSSEKRLARILLLFAHCDAHGPPEAVIPRMSHATLAEMVGTTRSRVCFFMKKFKAAGFLHYEVKDKMWRVRRTLRHALCE
jgi:CRP/FNR family cyclic AMP-dependent transcriptional regulator